MKRLLTLLILVIAALPSFAQGGSTLRISLSNNAMVAASVDDHYYEKRGTSLTIGDIPAGRHYLKVYNYRIGRNGNGRANLVYSGYVNLRQGSFNNCVIDPYRRMLRMRSRPDGDNATYERDNRDDAENRIDDRNFDRNSNDDIYENRDDAGYDRNDNNGVRENTKVRNRDNNGYNAPDQNAVTDNEINELGDRVKDKVTDTDKQKLIESALSGKAIYTSQVQTVLSWLSFESTKLEVAKWVYAQTIDKNNYRDLEDVFSFNSSKDELLEYIQSAK